MLALAQNGLRTTYPVAFQVPNNKLLTTSHCVCGHSAVLSVFCTDILALVPLGTS